MTDPQAGRFGAAEPGRPVLAPLVLPEEQSRPRARWPWMALALVIVASCTWAATRWALDRHEVTAWQVSTDLAAGAALDGETLTRVRVDSDDLAAGVLTGSASPEGVARVSLPAGTLLTRDAVAEPGSVHLPRGRVLVGLDLPPSQAPAGNLAPGDSVDLWAAPSQELQERARTPVSAVALHAARVWSVDASGDGPTVVSVVAPGRLAPRLTALAAAGRLAVTRR